MANPKVSVIVPVYKAEVFFKECIDSILNQTFSDFELILVDDCSPDNCPQMCDDYAKNDTRIKVIHNKPNLGSVKSYKAGLDASIGDYIIFVDSDDWIELDTIERLYKIAETDKCDIVYGDLIRFEGRKLAHTKPFDTRGLEKTDIILNLIDDNFPQFLVCRLFLSDTFSIILYGRIINSEKIQ